MTSDQVDWRMWDMDRYREYVRERAISILSGLPQHPQAARDVLKMVEDLHLTSVRLADAIPEDYSSEGPHDCLRSPSESIPSFDGSEPVSADSLLAGLRGHV